MAENVENGQIIFPAVCFIVLFCQYINTSFASSLSSSAHSCVNSHFTNESRNRLAQAVFNTLAANVSFVHITVTDCR